MRYVDLRGILQGHDLGCRVYENKLPIDTLTSQVAQEFQLNPTLCTLNGGEDYELLFTVDIKDHEKIKKLKDISIIGHMVPNTDGINLVLTGTEMLTPLKAQGWNHFKNS